EHDDNLAVALDRAARDLADDRLRVLDPDLRRRWIHLHDVRMDPPTNEVPCPRVAVGRDDGRGKAARPVARAGAARTGREVRGGRPARRPPEERDDAVLPDDGVPSGCRHLPVPSNRRRSNAETTARTRAATTSREPSPSTTTQPRSDA